MSDNQPQSASPPSQPTDDAAEGSHEAPTAAAAAAATSNTKATATAPSGDVVAAPDEKKMMDDLKTQCRSIVHSFRDEQHQIQNTLGSYKSLLTLYIKNTFYNDECREHILNCFLEESVVALMKREHIHFLTDWVMADLVSECCQLLVQIAVPLIADDPPLTWTIVYYCMNSSNPFFRHFGLDWVWLP